MLTGEKRWVSARRGMTVLGKVSVPKPVNLPSQRLENHGLDPNVAIVPKGTLSWRSRPSSSALNTWGFSALSPPATDVSSGLSSPLTGRPSSGGSRPSTAGSERSHEPVSNAWSNSMPSSASGILASNQTSVVSTRPRSAETRPGSSQLSRFGEPVPETSVAWGGPRMAEKLGTASTKHNGFTLSSGDFPTLCSEKNSEFHARRGHSSHGRPVSFGDAASQQERPRTPIDDGPKDASVDKRDVNTWRREASPPQLGGGTPPSMAGSQRNPQQAQPYPNMNMPSYHVEPWHGTPIRNSSEGVWYGRGPPSGPYRPAVPPGGYPLESFSYYPSQLPSRPVSKSQAGPWPGASPNAYHPENGDTYRPLTPDSYVVPSHPIIPIRPGFYPVPVPFDGYYGPPRMSFCNTNERDAPSMGLAGGPYVCNPNKNVHPDSGNFHFRPVGYGPSSVMTKDPMESTHFPDACRGPYKVLLKQHDSWDGNDSEEKREPSVKPMTQNDWEADCRKPMDLLKPAIEGSYTQLTNDKKEHSSIPSVRILPDNTSKTKAVDDGLARKPETASKAAEGPQQYPTIKKSPTLINKIEGLNTEARISEGPYEAVSVSTMEKAKEFRMENVKADHSTNESVSVVYNENACSGCMILSSSNDVVDAFMGDKNLESTTGRMVVSRQVETQDTSVSATVSSDVGEKALPEIHKRERGIQGRVDFRGRERLNIHEGERWKRKPLPKDSSVSVTNADACRDVRVQDHHTYQAATEKQEPNHLGEAGGGMYMTSSFDATDYQGQRAKMKEIATQRAKHLQKEEEERSREQKAKALAKLEELNKRTLAENATLQSESDLQVKKESLANAEQQTYNSVPDEVSGCVSSWAFNAVPQTELSTSKSMEAFDNSLQGPVVAVNLSVSSSQDANATKSAAEQISSQVHDDSLSKQKQMVHKRKQHNSQEKNLGDTMIATGGTKLHGNVIVNPNASSVESSLGNNVSANDDISLQHKKKNNRSTKNKHKADASIDVASLSPVAIEESLMKVSDESVKPKTLELVLEASSIQPQTAKEVVKNWDSQDVVCADQGWSQQTEEARARTNNQWKPQHPKKTSRNTQAFRPAEKFHGNDGAVWTPVHPPRNKNEPSEAADTNTTTDGGHSLGKNGYGTLNSPKGKKADIERYIPKPVAKELSLQESFQDPLTLSAQVISEDMKGKTNFGSESSKSLTHAAVAVVKTDFAVDSKNGESKHNRHGRTYLSWRQRSSAEPSTVLQSSREDPLPLDMKKTSQKPFEQQQPSKKDAHSPKGQALKYSDNWNINNPTSTEPVAAPVIVIDHGVSSRGKRQSSKVHRVTGYSHIRTDNEDLVVGVTNNTDSWASCSESSKADGSSSRVENQGVGENVSSHWQPKSQAFSTYRRQGWAGGGGQRITVQASGTPEKKEFSLLGTTHVQLQEERNDEVQSHTQKYVAHVINRSRRKDIDTFKEHTRIPNKGPPSIAELVPEDVDTHHEQQMISSWQHRQGPRNGRFNKGQEAPYGGVRGSSQGQEVNKQRLPPIGDRGKHNSHYEYQPVGSHNKPSDSFQHNPNVGEEARDGPRGMGLRYRERGQVILQSQSRRGDHFYGKNGSSGVGVATHGNGE